MAECTHDCSTCSHKCADERPPFEPCNKASKVKHLIGVVSGKGGVGKSSVTAMLATLMQRRGYKAAVLDADITGPSIPKAFGLPIGEVFASDNGMIPAVTKTGIKVMSVNLLMDEESKPVIWRGPVIAGTVKQFWTDVFWDEVDYMFVDMPPGTGDVPLTVFQSLPLDGIVIVTSPQELVGMIVGKAVQMANLMNIKVLGIVENFSYMKCSDCGKIIYPFGKSKIDEFCGQYGLDVLAKIPMDPDLAAQCDMGVAELFEGDFLDGAADVIEALPEKKN